MKPILLSLPIVLLSYFSASSQSYVLRQKDGLKVTVSPEYRSSHKDIFGTDMNMWKMNMSIENLTSDALEFKMNFSFVKYLNGATGSDEYIYSGRIEPRSLINKSGLQATEASCSNCDHLVKFKEWGVTNLTEQQRNQQYAQQQQQYQQQQQQQAYLQQQQAQQAAYQAQLQQQELQRQQEEATQGTVLFVSDIKVSVNINGQFNEELEANTPKRVKVQQGDVLLLITPAAAPDKVKQEVIKVEAQKQIVKNISLQGEFGALEKARIANEARAIREAEQKAKDAAAEAVRLANEKEKMIVEYGKILSGKWGIVKPSRSSGEPNLYVNTGDRNISFIFPAENLPASLQRFNNRTCSGEWEVSMEPDGTAIRLTKLSCYNPAWPAGGQQKVEDLLLQLRKSDDIDYPGKIAPNKKGYTLVYGNQEMLLEDEETARLLAAKLEEEREARKSPEEKKRDAELKAFANARDRANGEDKRKFNQENYIGDWYFSQYKLNGNAEWIKQSRKEYDILKLKKDFTSERSCNYKDGEYSRNETKWKLALDNEKVVIAFENNEVAEVINLYVSGNYLNLELFWPAAGRFTQASIYKPN